MFRGLLFAVSVPVSVSGVVGNVGSVSREWLVVVRVVDIGVELRMIVVVVSTGMLVLRATELELVCTTTDDVDCTGEECTELLTITDVLGISGVELRILVVMIVMTGVLETCTDDEGLGMTAGELRSGVELDGMCTELELATGVE